MFAFSNLKTNRNQSTEITKNECILGCYMKYLSKLHSKILESFTESCLIKDVFQFRIACVASLSENGSFLFTT